MDKQESPDKKKRFGLVRDISYWNPPMLVNNKITVDGDENYELLGEMTFTNEEFFDMSHVEDLFFLTPHAEDDSYWELVSQDKPAFAMSVVQYAEVDTIIEGLETRLNNQGTDEEFARVREFCEEFIEWYDNERGDSRG